MSDHVRKREGGTAAPRCAGGIFPKFFLLSMGSPFVEPFHSQGRVLSAAWPPSPYTDRPG